MKILILAAGYGTRLYPLTKDKPKPLLTINTKPLLNHLIDKFRDIDSAQEIIVVTNAKFFGSFKDWAKENDDFPIPISILDDGTSTPETRLGSIGDICFALKETSINDDLVVLGGDNLFDYDLDKFFDFSKQRADKVTVGLFDIVDKQKASCFGVAAVDEDQNVVMFKEKPQHPESSLIAMCLYYLPKNTFSFIREYIAQGGKQDLAGDYIGWLCDQKRLCGFQFQGRWYDIGNVEAYHQAQKDFGVGV